MARVGVGHRAGDPLTGYKTSGRLRVELFQYARNADISDLPSIWPALRPAFSTSTRQVPPPYSPEWALLARDQGLQALQGARPPPAANLTLRAAGGRVPGRVSI